MRLLVIINNTAARTRRAWPIISATLARAHIAFDVREPVGRNETEKCVRVALREGFETVAVVGGDGTLSAAASGFFESCAGLGAEELPRAVNASAALAILPAGTGDDFARGLTAGRRETLEAWSARLVRHARDAPSTRTVDLLLGSARGESSRFICLNAATLGIGAEVATRVAAQNGLVRRLPGEVRFGIAALAALAQWRDRRARVSVDGREWRTCRTNILAVVNGTHAGGGMNFSPTAQIDDGRLDLLTACGLTFPQILRELTRIHTGGHLRNPKVTVERGERVLIETVDDRDALGIEADGDVRGTTPAEFRIMPGALRVVF